jgi:hypothetical protein
MHPEALLCQRPGRRISEAIGTGTVSADGTVIESDPGVGVVKVGWNCR